MRGPHKEKAAIFLMRTCQSRVKSCAVGMCNAILGNDLEVARIIEHEKKKKKKKSDEYTLCKVLLVPLIYMMIWRGCT